MVFNYLPWDKYLLVVYICLHNQAIIHNKLLIVFQVLKIIIFKLDKFHRSDMSDNLFTFVRMIDD